MIHYTEYIPVNPLTGVETKLIWRSGWQVCRQAVVHVCGGAYAGKRACRDWCMHAWVPGLLGCFLNVLGRLLGLRESVGSRKDAKVEIIVIPKEFIGF